jgi:hypothetical protein
MWRWAMLFQGKIIKHVTKWVLEEFADMDSEDAAAIGTALGFTVSVVTFDPGSALADAHDIADFVHQTFEVAAENPGGGYIP